MVRRSSIFVPAALIVVGLLFPSSPWGSAALVAQAPPPGMVRGQILDGVVGRGVPTALIEFLDEQALVRASATTDGEGLFTLARVPRGTFRLRVSALGYTPTLSTSRRIDDGDVLTIVLRLFPDALPLDPLEVRAGEDSEPISPIVAAFHARALANRGGTFITRSEIERRNPTRVSEILATVPGVRLDPVGPPGSVVGITLSEAPSGSGGRPCPIRLFIDGVPTPRLGGTDARGASGLLLDQLLTPNEVEGIEVYRSLGEVPPEYLTQEAHCGVIAIWRRRGP